MISDNDAEMVASAAIGAQVIYESALQFFMDKHGFTEEQVKEWVQGNGDEFALFVGNLTIACVEIGSDILEETTDVR